MSYYSNELKTFLSNNIVKLLALFIVAAGIILFTAYYGEGWDKKHFLKYVTYEETINKKQQAIMTHIDGCMKEYYDNKRSKKEVVSNLQAASKDMEKLYDSFKWNKGDEITKELFIIKKEIILTYADIYINRARAISAEVEYNEQGDTDFIISLQDRYVQKDRYQRERYNLKFRT